MNIIIKTFKVIQNWIKFEKGVLDQKRRAKLTKILRDHGESDIKRWIKNDELHDNWNERTAIIAKMIPLNSKIIEFGAGNMELKKIIPNSSLYTASDICQRFPEMLVCDLNKGINFALDPYNTAIFSGVLEYVYNVDHVFKTLAKNNIRHIILSYACSDVSLAPRLERGWLSDYTTKELARIFYKNGYEIIEYKEWRKQSIYHLKRN